MYNTLLFSVTDHIATISFNRPDAMNCYNLEMGIELAELTERVKLDSSIKAVILNGAGHAFIAGGDIQYFSKQLPAMPAGVTKLVRLLNSAILDLMYMPKPVIASVHGAVAGAGVSLMMACDLVIAAQNTKFTLAYTGIGISPDGGASYNLPRLVGTKKAMEWMLFSDMFDAQTALNSGLINWLAAPEKLSEETQKLAQRLAQGPTQSYANSKKLINSSWQNSLETHLEQEGKLFAACSTTSDFKTGVTAFLKKTKPEFVGR